METWTSPKNNTRQKPEGEGWQITGYKPVRIAMNPNRMGSGFRTEQVPIYGRSAPAPAAAPPQQAAAPAPKAASAPRPSPESDRYRKEAEGYMKQAQDMLNQFKIEQQRAAEAARLAEEMRIKSQATAAANMARSQQAPNLQIEPASGTPDTAGTQGFKRRKGPQLAAKGAALSALNIGSSNLMNV